MQRAKCKGQSAKGKVVENFLAEGSEIIKIIILFVLDSPLGCADLKFC